MNICPKNVPKECAWDLTLSCSPPGVLLGKHGIRHLLIGFRVLNNLNPKPWGSAACFAKRHRLSVPSLE